MYLSVTCGAFGELVRTKSRVCISHQIIHWQDAAIHTIKWHLVDTIGGGHSPPRPATWHVGDLCLERLMACPDIGLALHLPP